MRIGVYPGSFDPPTRAHLAIADAARCQLDLDRVVLALSVDALGKDPAAQGALDARIDALAGIGDDHGWLAVTVTEHRLIADIAAGYDAVIVGADKWAQMLDPAWYPSTADHDAALARLPLVAVAPRTGHDVPLDPRAKVVVLDLDDWVGDVSSSAVRAGRHDWIAPGAAHLLPPNSGPDR